MEHIEGNDEIEIIEEFRKDAIELFKTKKYHNRRVRMNQFLMATGQIMDDYYEFPKLAHLQAYFEKMLSDKNHWSANETIFKLNGAIFKVYGIK